jgi:hypothetical protein
MATVWQALNLKYALSHLRQIYFLGLIPTALLFNQI